MLGERPGEVVDEVEGRQRRRRDDDEVGRVDGPAGLSLASSMSSSARATAGPEPLGLHAEIVQSSGLRRSA